MQAFRVEAQHTRTHITRIKIIVDNTFAKNETPRRQMKRKMLLRNNSERDNYGGLQNEHEGMSRK